MRLRSCSDDASRILVSGKRLPPAVRGTEWHDLTVQKCLSSEIATLAQGSSRFSFRKRSPFKRSTECSEAFRQSGASGGPDFARLCKTAHRLRQNHRISAYKQFVSQIECLSQLIRNVSCFNLEFWDRSSKRPAIRTAR